MDSQCFCNGFVMNVSEQLDEHGKTWRIRELNLKGCRLRPTFLKKALQEHPLGRSHWLPVETLASLPLAFDRLKIV